MRLMTPEGLVASNRFSVRLLWSDDGPTDVKMVSRRLPGTEAASEIAVWIYAVLGEVQVEMG